MRCEKCGNELLDGAKFCPECGTPVAAHDNEDVAQTQEMPKPEPPAPEPTAPEPSAPEPTAPEPPQADAPKPWYTTTPARIVMGVCGVILVVVGIVRIVGAFGPSSGGSGGSGGLSAGGLGNGKDSGSVATITFDGGGAHEGEVTAIEAQKGSTFKLPENGFTWKDCEFAGWVPSNNKDSEPLPAGTEQTAEESTTYTAAWNVTISFDGNGSEEGKMQAVTALSGSLFELPQCKFKRDGFTFGAWTTNLDDGEGTKRYQPGDEYPVHGPVTFYARWDEGAPRASVSITDAKKEVTGSLSGWGGKASGCILLVKNDTSDTLNIDADFKFFSGKADKGHQTDNALAVGPGQTVMLYGIDLKHADGVNYTVTCKKSEAWMLPLDKNLDVQATESDADHLKLTITNNGTYPVLIAKVRCMVLDKEGTYHGGDSFTYGTIEPGKSLDATFEKSNMYDMTTFTSFEDVTVAPFVSGYVNTTSSGK